MSPEDFKQRTKVLALRVIKLCGALPRSIEGKTIANQLVRCGTSVGANYRAACRARSRADFVAKLGIVEEEADETCFWLEIIVESAMLAAPRVRPLLQETNEILAMTSASRISAKKAAS